MEFHFESNSLLNKKKFSINDKKAKVDSGRDQMKELLSDYFESVNSYKEKCPLDFWKMHEEKYTPLAQLAKM
jgi:hypothetical protein